MSAITMNNQQSSTSAPNQLLNGAKNGPNFDSVNQTLEKLMVSEPFPLEILDSLVHDLHYGNTQARSTSQHILVLFKESELAWTKVDYILQKSDVNETKFFALQTLEHTIDKRWKILPREQCEGIRNFIIAIIIKISEEEETMKKQKLYLNKLNLVLVKILKHDWPQHWPTALQDIVGSARNGESICQNNLEILRLLSEEIFDFSEDSMVQNKIKHLKETMCEQFRAVFELCYFLIDNSDNETLILTCLKTLLRFTSWVPYGYIFETELIKKLTTRLLPYHFFRNTALACLTEIASLPSNKPDTKIYEKTYLEMYKKAYNTIEEIIPSDLDMRQAYKAGSDKEQKLIQNLALFLTTFASTHSHLIPKTNADPEFIKGYRLLVQISYVDDVEVFKICLDFWHDFAHDLYSTENLQNRNPGWGTWGAPTYSYDDDYKNLLIDVRKMMLCKMAKPEEVLVVENDQGQVVREVIKDTDSHILYQTCKETLVFLTNLDTKVTETLMDKKLSRQVDDSEWSWDTLNRLCWSIGSISGAMSEDDERRFLVNVIKDLLGLCEQKRGKDNKAIIASNIMYVVGQYPRFLRAHWKFLKTVVNKLFEFMHETHDGVQDMACDTFLKIAQKCKNHFVSVQNGESQAFIVEILNAVKSIIADLQPHQIQAFYESLGYMIAAQKDPEIQPELIKKYMELPNDVWEKNIQNIGYDLNNYLNNGDNLRHLSTILKTNHRACKSLGHAYIYQLSDIFSDMINIYKVFTEHICAAYIQNKDSLKEQNVKEMRSVKKEILTLTTLWINSCKDKEMLKNEIIPNLLEPILQDYTNSPPEAKEPEVIACTEAIIKALGENSSDYINVMFAAVFESTLEMISSSDSEFPEHRTYFFKFLSAINGNVFTAMLKMNETQFRLVLDAIIWGMKQMMQECKETSLQILEQLLENVANSTTYEQSQQFYKTYYVFILEHIFEVSTNILHAKANLQQHAILLAYMIKLVDSSIRHGSGDCIETISVKLAPQELLVNNPENQQNNKYIYNHIANLLKTQFGNQVVDQQIQVFVEGLFTLYDSKSDYISHLRDFLIQMREKRGEDTEDLFLEERMREIKQKKSDKEAARMKGLANIPGMSNQYEGMNSIVDEM